MKIVEKNDTLVITEFSEMEAYQIACTIEKDGLRFYRRLLQDEQSPDAKKTLEFMIAEEQRHLRFFEDRLRAQEQKADLDAAANDILDSLDYGVFAPYQNMAELEKILTDAKKVLRLGIRVEEKTRQFYELCRDQVTSTAVRKELARIIDEEGKHRALLQERLQQIEQGSVQS
ncbi:MAG: ferritin family protein [Candidatus Omnitrophica bacterium]|nr:ferritin family protein [Candidatus Omnitrophota bacterium]